MVGTETAVNIQSNVKKSIPDNSLINIELSKEKMGEYNAVVKSGDVAVCGLLKNATGQPFFKPIITKLLEFTNLPHQCPFPVVSWTLMTNLWVIVCWPSHVSRLSSPQGEYWIKDFMIDSSMIPDIIPEGRYKVVAGIFQPLPSHKLIYESEWIFSIATTAI